MATVAAGSTLVGELYRLAGVTDIAAFKGLLGAANAYAETTGRGLLGALNYKASSTRTPDQFKGLTAVCNELAGTTGKSAVDALRSIDL